mmetsp:Transcript_50543/g.120283  ORF Transcript_50543/g.120283 Transcript_50543/m.120283 type:complete len:88 (+) Transcript_50543:90-353(+)
MFALILQVESLAGGPRYGTWAPPGFLSDPSKGWHSDVESGFTECPSRACQFTGIFAHNGRLAGELPDCWADGLCRHPVGEPKTTGPE